MRKIAILFTLTLGVMAITAGCSSAPKDQSLTTEIKANLFSDPQVKVASVDVSVKDGEATLSGEVPDDGARYKAYKIASDTPGVKHVVDQMTIHAALVKPAPEPAPVKPHPTPKPTRKAVKHQAAPVVKSVKSVPEPEPAPRTTSVTPMPSAQPEMATALPSPPPPPQPKRVEIPAGTSVRVQMIDGVDSEVNHAGEMFHATLDSPIVVDNQIVVPAGTDIYVKLTNAKSAGHMTGQSTLALELARMEYQGKSYPLDSNDYQQTGSSRGKRTAETVGGGAVLGTILGAVIGGGKGAAIGAATGAGAGGVVQGVTKGEQVKIPSETKLDFSLEQPVDISYFPDKNRSSRE